MGFELSTAVNSADLEDAGMTIALLDESGDPYVDPETDAPITARVCGTYSKRFAKAQRKQQERASRTPGRLSFEQQQAMQHELYAVAVLSWDLTLNGTSADPVAVFQLKPHLFEQIMIAANNHAAFFAQSSTR